MITSCQFKDFKEFLEHNKDLSWSIYLFSNDIFDGDLVKLRVTLEKTNSNSTLHLINVNDDDFKQFHGFWENHGRQVFYRFVIPGYIPISFIFSNSNPVRF